MTVHYDFYDFCTGNRRSELPPSPCEGCSKNCKGERCPGWVKWFSKSWTQVRELFR